MPPFSAGVGQGVSLFSPGVGSSVSEKDGAGVATKAGVGSSVCHADGSGVKYMVGIGVMSIMVGKSVGVCGVVICEG